MDKIKVFSPGSITNLSCGYDILGVSIPWQLTKNRIKYKEVKNIKLEKKEGV